MRFYRVHYESTYLASLGVGWYTNKRDAMRAVAKHRRDNPEDHAVTEEPEPVDIEPTKTGILWALRVYASHPDNG